MRKLYFILIIIYSQLFFSCKKDYKKSYYDQDDRLVIEFYKNRKLDQRQIILSDTTYILKFYNDGLLIDSALYVNDSIVGTRLIYNLEESLIYKLQYNDLGIQEGLDSLFYPTGEIYGHGESRKGKKFGEWKFFFKDGSLNTYEFFNRPDDLTFLRGYNEKGEITKSMGSAIGFIYSQSKTTLSTEDVYSEKVFLVDLPNSIINLDVNIRNAAGTKNYDFELGTDSARAYLDVQLIHEGSYTRTYKWELIDTVLLDTLRGEENLLLTVESIPEERSLSK